MSDTKALTLSSSYVISSQLSNPAKQHDHIWSSAPFLPWASNSFDGVHPGGEGHAIVSDFDYEAENLSGGSGKQAERGNAFRRIFYRSADSVRVRSGDWGAVSGGKYLFYGVALKSEFDSVSQWYSHRYVKKDGCQSFMLSAAFLKLFTAP